MRKDTEDYVGSCQACLGEHKVNAGRQIVLHGYQRPGNGEVLGKCPGAYHPPFEYDHKLTEQIILAYRKTAADALDFKTRLLAGQVLELQRHFTEYDKVERRRVDRVETIGPDSPHWDRQVEIAAVNADGEARWFTSCADFFQRRVDSWERGSIAGLDSPVTGKVRNLRGAYDPIEEEKQKRLAEARAERDARPGKLKLVVCWPREIREELAAEEKAAVRAWARAMFPEGKLSCTEDYDSQLPVSYRRAGGFFHILVIRMDWSYRNQVADLIAGAEATETEPKRRAYLLDATNGKPW